MASNDHKTAAELEREVEMQRERLSDTIDELQDRLSPGQIVDQLMSYTKGGAGDFAQNMGKSMMANPLPVALLGVSLLWLMSGKNPMHSVGRNKGYRARTSANYHPPYYDGVNTGIDYDDDYYAGENGSDRNWASGVGDKLSGVGDKLSGVGSKVSDVGHGIADTVSGAAAAAGDAMGHARDAIRGAGEQLSGARHAVGDGMGQARERMSGMREGLSHRAHDLRDRARDMRHRADDLRHQAMDMQGTAMQFLADQPLIGAALAFAAGAALGAALPVTSKENELLGETSDEVKTRIREAAEPLVSQAKDVLGDVVEEGRTVLNETMEQGKTMLNDTMRQGKDALGEAQNKLGESYGHIKETVRDAAESALSTDGSGMDTEDDEQPSGSTSDQASGYGQTPSSTPRQTW